MKKATTKNCGLPSEEPVSFEYKLDNIALHSTTGFEINSTFGLAPRRHEAVLEELRQQRTKVI